MTEQTPTPPTHRCFFYGSLREGHYNHAHFLRDVPVVARGSLKGFDLYSLGAYPMIVPGDGTVVGEVFDVDSRTFAMIDRMELGAGYRREQAAVDTPEGLIQATVYVYDRAARGAKVPSGDWNEVMNPENPSRR